MATNMTFDTLKDDVRKYLERGASAITDPVVYEQIPRLINLAERRIARELKITGFIEVVTDHFIPGQSVYRKPDRWRDTVSMNYGNGPDMAERTPIFTRGYEYARAYWPNESQQASPEFYADYNYSHWLFVPTPDAAYPFEILYYALPPMLDDTVQSNWITDYAPQLLLYATLLEASPFLKNDERISTWQTFYDRAAAMINGEDIAKMLDRAQSRKET
jgi:hypothetical protein